MPNKGIIFFLFVSSWITLTILYKTQYDSSHFYEVPISPKFHPIKINGSKFHPIKINNPIKLIDYSSLPEDFINFVIKIGLDEEIFLTDPVILHSLLPSSERSLLIKNRFMTKNVSNLIDINVNETKPLITFGIVISSKKIHDKIESFCSNVTKVANHDCQEYRSERFLGYKNLEKIRERNPISSRNHT